MLNEVTPLGRFFAAMKGARKMNRQELSQQVMFAVLVMLLLVGCGAPAATPSPVPPTAAATVTSAESPHLSPANVSTPSNVSRCHTIAGPSAGFLRSSGAALARPQSSKVPSVDVSAF